MALLVALGFSSRDIREQATIEFQAGERGEIDICVHSVHICPLDPVGRIANQEPVCFFDLPVMSTGGAVDNLRAWRRVDVHGCHHATRLRRLSSCAAEAIGLRGTRTIASMSEWPTENAIDSFLIETPCS